MRKKRKIPYFIKDIVPPLFSLVFAISYFVSVQRGILPFVKGYVIAVAGLLLVSRIPKVWYFKKYLIPPIAEYKRAKSQGRVLSSKKTLGNIFTSRFFRFKSTNLHRSNMGRGNCWFGNN